MSNILHNCTVGMFSSSIRKQYPQYWDTLNFIITDMEHTCGKLDNPLSQVLSIKRHIYYIAIMNAVQLCCACESDVVFGKVMSDAARSDDPYFQEMVAIHKEKAEQGWRENMLSMVYLAYMEHELGKQYPVFDRKWILPGKTESSILINLVYSIAKTLKPDDTSAEQVIFKPSLAGGYTSVVSSGTVDFRVGDTLWVIRLRQPPKYAKLFYGHEYIPLLVSAIMMNNTAYHQDSPVSFIGCMSPLDGKYTHLAIQDVDKIVVELLTKHIYLPVDKLTHVVSVEGTQDTMLSDETAMQCLERLERVKLVTAFVLTADIFKTKHQVQYELTTICGDSITDRRVKNICREILELYVKPPRLFDVQCPHNRKRVELLSHLYYTINNLNRTRIHLPKIPDETITDIINKAAALYY